MLSVSFLFPFFHFSFVTHCHEIFSPEEGRTKKKLHSVYNVGAAFSWKKAGDLSVFPSPCLISDVCCAHEGHVKNINLLIGTFVVVVIATSIEARDREISTG